MHEGQQRQSDTLGSDAGGLRGVVLASPGGLAGGGGMGSVTRAMKAWMAEHTPDIQVDVIDPRSEGRALWSLLYGPAALVRLVHCKVWKGHSVLHLQVSERLSFVRKSALMFVARALKMRVVLHHHGAELIPFFRSASPRMKRLVRWAVCKADVNIVLGEVWRTFLLEEVGVPSERVVIAINATRDFPTREPAADRDPWHFLVLANLSPRKGIGELLEAIALLAQRGLPAKLTLAGGGEVDRYRRQAEALQIGQRCTFTGWIQGDAVTDLLFDRSVLVLPSHHEGLPMTIIEALSARLPVLTTPVGSIPEHLAHEATCLFVQPGDVVGIADALQRLAAEPELRHQLTTHGRALYEERFGLNGYMLRMLAVYASLSPKAASPR